MQTRGGDLINGMSWLTFSPAEIPRTLSETPHQPPSLHKQYEEATMSKTAIPKKPARQLSKKRANLSMRSQEVKSVVSIVAPAGRKYGESFKVRPSESARREATMKRNSK